MGLVRNGLMGVTESVKCSLYNESAFFYCIFSINKFCGSIMLMLNLFLFSETDSNSGSSRDWATDLEIPFSYTFELRDNGTYGFVLPEDQIQPTCEEATAGILSIVNYLNEKHFNSASSIFSDTLWIHLSFSIVIGTYYSLY